MIDNRLLRAIAEERERGHIGHRFGDRWKPNATYIGLIGEAEFARQTGLNVDLSWRPGGDQGVDFSTSVGTVDVKTAEFPKYLFLKTTAEHFAEIYVLARYVPYVETAELIGYATLDELQAAPLVTTDYCVNHAIPAHRLHDIRQLLHVIRLWGG